MCLGQPLEKLVAFSQVTFGMAKLLHGDANHEVAAVNKGPLIFVGAVGHVALLEQEVTLSTPKYSFGLASRSTGDPKKAKT